MRVLPDGGCILCGCAGAPPLTTGKSRHRREAIIPLYSALRGVLDRIPKRATTILTSSKRRPWTADGFGSSFNKAKIDAGMSEQDLHFNDLRGTAATKFYIAGHSMREIAETLEWERGICRENHPPLCRPGCCHQGADQEAGGQRMNKPAKPMTKLPC